MGWGGVGEGRNLFKWEYRLPLEVQGSDKLGFLKKHLFPHPSINGPGTKIGHNIVRFLTMFELLPLKATVSTRN